MNSETKVNHRPNLAFSHFGMSTVDLPKMVEFYTRILGFTITDRGGDQSGMELVFLSRDPADHHQLLLVSGRPENLPPNPYYPQFGSVINQISFRMSSLEDLRELHDILRIEGVPNIFPANHGIAWSVYAHDPDGNNLEFFVDTDWYFPQPALVPLDFSKSNDQIRAETQRHAHAQAGFEMYSAWRERMGRDMNKYVPGV